MRELFIGRAVHWALWAVVVAVLAVLGAHHAHNVTFNWFVVAVLALAAGSVLVLLATYRKGERITRDPFERD